MPSQLRNYLPVALLALCIAAFLWWSAPIFLSLHERWLRAGFEHGYPVAILSLILVVMRIRTWGFPIIGPSGVGLAFLTIFVALATIAHAATITIVPELLLPAMVLAFTWALFGWPAAAVLLAPLLFLYFSIPFWQLFESLSIAAPSLNEQLRLLTTFVASGLVRATGIPAYIEGDLIHISAGTFKIAQGCSGRAYFIVALELSLFFGIAFLREWRHTLALVGVAAMLSLVGNWLRVFALIVIGQITHMKSPLIHDHEAFGWVIFAIILIPIFLFGRTLEDKGQAEPRIASGHASEPSSRGPVLPLLVVGVLVTGILLENRIEHTYARPAEAGPIHLPVVEGWRIASPWSGDSRPDFRAAAAEDAAWYRNARTSVGVYLANYPVQQQGSEAIYFANKPAGNLGKIIDVARVELLGAASIPYTFRQYKVSDGDSVRLVWYSVVVAGTNTHGALHAKVIQATGALGGRVDAQVVILASDCGTHDCKGAAYELSEFASVAIDDLYAAAERSTLMQLRP